MSGPSVWWPTPARPSRWFSQTELDAAARYNDPLRHSARLRDVARVALAVGAGLVLPEGRGLVEILTHTLVFAAAFWAPAAVTDAWFEFVHEPKFPSVVPRAGGSVPPAHFVVGSISTLVFTAVVIFVGLGSWIGVMGRTEFWPLVVIMVVVALGGFGRRSGASIARLTHGVEAADADLSGELREVAERAGVDVDSFGVVERSGHQPGSPMTGHNAFVAGLGNGHRVVLTAALAEASPSVRDHVVAHELAHVARRDLTVSTGAWIAAVAGAFIAGGWFGPALHDAFPALSELSALTFGAAIALALGLLPVAWLSRAHERRADLDALRLLQTADVEDVREAFVTDRADLRAVPRLGRLWASHPSPAERLELAHRALSRD